MIDTVSRILVTGGAGFLGSHLCGRLIREGNRVLCLDNLITGRRANIEPLIDNPNFKFIRRDVAEPIDFEVDQIYNLACPASPVHYQADPIKTIETNFFGARNVLMLAERNRARVLQASTSEVYGDPKVHPQPESYWGSVNPIGLRACYDEGKRIAETLFFDHHRQRGTDIRVIRIFNTYGPRMSADDGRVVSNFIVQALAGRDITVYGDGAQTRSFCYVDDLIEGIIRVMNADNLIGPINLGNPGEFTVLELAEKIIALTQSKSKIIHAPLPSDDPVRRQPVIDLAREKLSWAPKVALEDGLIKTIEYFRERLSSDEEADG